ncbi:hypothetical protein B0T16DRAFT_459292 [Cercophora newfieldiana]|uniref:Uncharacterized protein n=1 Tax=Cercophora newfieldiana TaxID=92897 RepID=A0AA39XZD7_9PEZI|nr:hypothetical protein B0T16DRAFT_459292 [Cercophora newfieldiana]
MESPHHNLLAPEQEQDPSIPSKGRILDRKIPSRGPANTFSSNLARRPSPSPRKTTTSSGKSVREMANLFEKGQDGSPPSRPRNLQILVKKRDERAASAATTSVRSVSSKWSDATDGTKSVVPSIVLPMETERKPVFDSCSRRIFSPALPSPALTSRSIASLMGNEYQAEENSLTLLNYKAYFNNRPLGRCLDDFEEAEAAKERAEAVAKKETSQKKKETSHNLTRSVTLQNIMAASTPVERLDKLMEALQELDLEADHDDDKPLDKEMLKPTNAKQEERRRDAEEVNAF